MWVIVPVKQLENAKFRLAELLSQQQRVELSVMMLHDVLQTLSSASAVSGITIISSDPTLAELAEKYGAEFLLTDSDSGYSEDAKKAIDKVCEKGQDTIAIIPADVPMLSVDDICRLNGQHKDGITLCPALIDGGTNALLFSSPLRIPLLFGLDSLQRYKNKAAELRVPVNIERVNGLERDIDRPEDINWLREQSADKRTIQYLKELELATIT